MSHHWSDNVHTTAFTPRDYQVELLACAREQNIIICLGHNSSKEFIALKLIHELGHQLRRNDNKKITFYLSNNYGDSAYNLIYHLTDLKIINLNNEQNFDYDTDFDQYHVIILNAENFLNILICGYITLDDINLIIIEDCHRKAEDGNNYLSDIFNNYYNNCINKPKVLGLAGPLHSAGCPPGRLGAELEHLENAIQCRAETASDIVTVLRYCSKPIEIILQCAPPRMNELTEFLYNLVLTKKTFLNDHRFDPSEIYSDEFLEELKCIPDPKIDPLQYLDDFLSVLNDLGPWCADRAAFLLLLQLEKQKIKTPYERHYLLLCLITTTLIEIRAHCTYVFQKLLNEKERVEQYSTPKVLRILEIVRLYKPTSNKDENSKFKKINNEIENKKVTTNDDNINKVIKEIENLNFKGLKKKSEEIKNKIENEKSTNIDKIKEKLDNITKHEENFKNEDNKEIPNEVIENKKTKAKDSIEVNKMPINIHSNSFLNKRSVTSNKYEPRHYRHRKKYGQHIRSNRNNYNNANDSELLCGIIFCNSRFMAKILFSLFHEMSRNDSDLNYLNVQYTVDKVANPQTEIKEAEAEHKKQEEVLKKFRMHECNLLIGTSVLEEGIDLPKCNLVVRWDPPITYRSYVQCKGRARAPQAYYIIMVAPTISNNSYYNEECEFLTNKNHKFVCHPGVIKTIYKKVQNKIDLIKNCSNKLNTCDELIKYENKRKTELENNVNGNVKIEEYITNGVDHEIEDNLNTVVDEKVEENIENGIKDIISLDDENTNRIFFDSTDDESNDETSTDSESIKSCCANSDNDMHIDENYYDKLLDNMNLCTEKVIKRLAQYIEIEKMLIRKCENIEPLEYDLLFADQFTTCILPYKPLINVADGASVNLSTAVALVNKYCAKLPSDTFTKLTPLWRYAKTIRKNVVMFQCTLRLPINSPLKEDIVGLPMPTRILARRVAALIASKILHQSGELDDNLQPIGKEGFRASESDWENFELEKNDELIVNDNSEPRPGTTKRRQYYYKRIASAFSNCRPKVGEKAFLYHISMVLQCPIPEEQNTRGRKIYPPEDARQHFGILTLKRIPKISAFPIFTRSGEVKVSLELVKDDVLLEESQLLKVYTFINYTFTNVLRLQKYLMLFDPDATENCFFIVPTVKNKNDNIEVDWDFLDLITNNSDKIPQPVSEEERKVQEFDANIFKDAVVMPWYRNQDQPQYFYVAEICYHLSPESSFPGENYTTFQEYYYRKYSIEIQNRKQPLLDVDHTSARLNFLTPRYVNRKGVALPTSSEETKRAKRENLEQKQILVPELCTIHPFTASLWRAAVCLPCILYRINALLLADEIRKKVSNDLGLGKMDIVDNLYEWPSLDFGWSLADVLKKSRESKQLLIEDVEDLNETTAPKKGEKYNENEDNPIISEEGNEKTANEILEEVDRKIKNECTMEIGTWSNEMADNISINDDLNEDDWGLLPPNVNMCSGSQIRYGSPTSWDYGTNNVNPIDPYYSDSDTSFQTDEDYDNTSVASNDEQNFKLHIEFKSDNLAEAIETEEEILKRKKQLDIINNTNANEIIYQNTKNICVGFDSISNSTSSEFIDDNYNNIKWHENEFLKSTEKLENDIRTSNVLVKHDESFKIVKSKEVKILEKTTTNNLLNELIPYAGNFNEDKTAICLEELYSFNKIYSEQHGIETFTIEGSGNIFDNFNDQLITGYKEIALDFSKDLQISNLNKNNDINNEDKLYNEHLNEVTSNDVFNFDYQPNLVDHPGPSPSIILQALTMSNANDGINLERLETIGDSFLKYAITTYLYCTYENVHEGKLSHLRSKQVSNLNLYRLGRRKILGESMIATKFEPHDNWLPPCYYVPRELEQALIEAKIPACHWDLSDMPNLKDLSSDEICKLVKKRAEVLGVLEDKEGSDVDEEKKIINKNETTNFDNFPFFIPYNLVTQHSIPDKSVADCVEALIGAYLIECGPRGALLFMAWLGIRVLPIIEMPYKQNIPRIPGSIISKNNEDKQIVYGKLIPPKSPLLCFVPNPHETLDLLLDGYSDFENAIGYHFNDRSYLLQAMTHASYSPNRLTDCYQRLEFLGDAVLDYLITRHLYEDPRQHSPGALTDLRSALVNNTIFASLAVRHNFHKYFRHLSPGLNEVIERFVRIQHENGHSISEEYYLISEEECDEAEDVEVPKALGDVFESVAGAIFLDSNMSLDTVWKVYSNMMRPEIEQFSNSVPKSPIRELLELEPETAKFGKPEKLADGRRVRVTVEVFGKGTYRGIGRNYRIAKCTAAKCALRQLKKQGLITKKH